MGKAFFIASTGQHVGKTTTCLGLVSGLMKRYKNVGFMKPVGQEHVMTPEGVRVDKDVALFKEWFQLKNSYESMSPVLFPRGFTRDYLDGKVHESELLMKIKAAHQEISATCDCMAVEGTGHVGVGSIVNLNNAQVAKSLDANMVMIASGGLGSSFDAIAINKTLCDREGVRIAGIILNRVLDDKRGMILEYFEKALKRWDIPILGCIPYNPLLSNPTMKDYASLFDEKLLSGEQDLLRHFLHTRLVATSVDVYRELITRSQLIITPASREDIILATLSKHWDCKISHPEEDLEVGIILTGSRPPRKKIVEDVKKANIPMFYTPMSSFKTMQKINSYTAKIRKEDTEKVTEAIHLAQTHIDFDALIECADLPPIP
jgi:phosphate acetyltransferase